MVEFAALMALLVFGIWGYWLWRKWQDLPGFADTVYEARREQSAFGEEVGKDAFREAFIKCEAPRSHTYRFAAGLLSTLLLPLLVYVFNRIWDFIWVLLGAREGPFERGYMVHTFLTYVFVMAVVIGLTYFLLRHFHSKTPPTLKSEIRRLTGEKS